MIIKFGVFSFIPPGCHCQLSNTHGNGCWLRCHWKNIFNICVHLGILQRHRTYVFVVCFGMLVPGHRKTETLKHASNFWVPHNPEFWELFRTGFPNISLTSLKHGDVGTHDTDIICLDCSALKNLHRTDKAYGMVLGMVISCFLR